MKLDSDFIKSKSKFVDLMKSQKQTGPKCCECSKYAQKPNFVMLYRTRALAYSV